MFSHAPYPGFVLKTAIDMQNNENYQAHYFGVTIVMCGNNETSFVG